MPGDQNEPRRQHMISKVLLHRFAVNKELISHNLSYGTHKPQHPSQVAYRESFISVRRGQMERLWDTTERVAQRALVSATDGSIFDKPREVLALKELIALHFMRRDIVKDVHDAGLERVLAAYQPSVDLGALQPALIEEARRQIRHEAPKSHADTQERLLIRARAQVAAAGLEVSRTGQEPVLIGDQAVLSFRGGRATYVPFMAAQSHVLPIGPRHYISLGPSDSWRLPDRKEVVRMNVEQIRQARQKVFFSPTDTSQLEALISEQRLGEREKGERH